MINGITSGCFAVKAVNGCMPGDYSPQVCSGSAGQVLGASTLGATGTGEYINLLYALGFLLIGLGLKKNSSKNSTIIVG